MNPIEAVEAAIIARVKALADPGPINAPNGAPILDPTTGEPLTGGFPLEVASLPSRFSVQELKTRIHRAPGVFVAFQGGAAIEELQAAIDGEFAVYVAMSNARGEKARRLGDVNRPGAYQLLTLVAPALQNLLVPGVGSLVLKRVENLFAEELDQEGISLYAAMFAVPLVLEPENMSGVNATLSAFRLYHADFVDAGREFLGRPPLGPGQGEIASDLVRLSGTEMAKIRVKLAPGRRILDPATMGRGPKHARPLHPDGHLIDDTEPFWFLLLRDGDVIRMTDAEIKTVEDRKAAEAKAATEKAATEKAAKEKAGALAKAEGAEAAAGGGAAASETAPGSGEGK